MFTKELDLWIYFLEYLFTFYFIGLKEFIKCCHNDEGNVDFVTLYLKNSPECKDLFGLFEIGGRPEPEKVKHYSMNLIMVIKHS